LLEWSRHLQGPIAKNRAKSLINQGFPARIANFFAAFIKYFLRFSSLFVV